MRAVAELLSIEKLLWAQLYHDSFCALAYTMTYFLSFLTSAKIRVVGGVEKEMTPLKGKESNKKNKEH